MRLLPVLLLYILASVPARAEPDPAMRAAMSAEQGQEADGEALLALAGRLSGLELPEVPDATLPVAGPVEVRAGKIQAALTQLAILAGGNGHLSLQLAQASRTDVIDVVSGTATLADLGAVEGLVKHRDKAWRLSRPLVIWPGAALVLSPGEVLELD
ncbi:MAG: hypothetical protein EON48_19500, partial [Acetobacteraceae bacterium]